MDRSKKSKQNPKYLVHCLRCNQTSYVDLVAKCKHCGSYAVKMMTKEKKK